MTKLPRLLDRERREIARLQPVRLTVTWCLPSAKSLSHGAMVLPRGEARLKEGSFLALTSPDGAPHVFRIDSVTLTADGRQQAAFRHGLSLLSDVFLPGRTDVAAVNARYGLTGSRRGMTSWFSYLMERQQETVFRRGACDSTLAAAFTFQDCSLLTALMLMTPPGCRWSTDQGGDQWALHLQSLPAAVTAELRPGRNMGDYACCLDESGMVTRLYAEGADETVTLPFPGYLSAGTAAEFGIREGFVRFPQAGDAATLSAYAAAWLAQRKVPRCTMTARAADLAPLTGEKQDCLIPGALCRVCLPGEPQRIFRIMSVCCPDLAAAPEEMTVTLSDGEGDA